jgi:hypothetical protein
LGLVKRNRWLVGGPDSPLSSALMTNAATNSLVIPLSKITLILLGSIAFVALGFWLWAYAEEIRYRSPLFVRGVAAAAVGFFGLCGVLAIVKLFDFAPRLIVDSEGIIDNSSAIAAGRILWADIRGFEIQTVQNQRFLTIQVYDPEKYVQRSHFLKRAFVALNASQFGGLFCLASLRKRNS